MKHRESDLQKEHEKQKEHEIILNSLLKTCKDFISFVDNSLKGIAQDSEGTEEEKLHKVESYGQDALHHCSEKLKGIKEWSDKVDEADISELAEYSYQEMESLGDQIKKFCKQKNTSFTRTNLSKKNGISIKRTITRVS